MSRRPPLRVDAPWGPARLLIEAWGWLAGVPVFLLVALLRHLVRIEHVDRPAEPPRVVCAWHDHLPATFLALFPTTRPTVWMNHPAWYMRPVHRVLRWSGVGSLALGSSGHGGKAALARVIEEVQGGAATFLNPDGPYGPVHEVKDGVLDLALRTGQPITALSFRYRGAVRLPTWDHKLLPLPGGRLEVRWSEPIVVTEATREDARRVLAVALEVGEETPERPH